jgi:hypothetical protein
LEFGTTEKTVIGVGAILQAGLTAAAALTGGLPSLFLNEKGLAIAGLSSLVGAAALLALAAVLANLEPTSPYKLHLVSRTWVWWLRFGLVVAAVVAFAGAIGITAYAAVRLPGADSEPEIAASLTPGNPLVLKATVKASGVAKGSNLNIYVEGVQETGPNGIGPYSSTDPVLYQAHIGAGASGGDVNDTFSVPIPVGKYNDVEISAWKGNSRRCGTPSTQGTFKGNKACVTIRLVHIGAPPKASAGIAKR